MWTILTAKSQGFISEMWYFIKTLPIWAQIISLPLLTFAYLVTKNIFKNKTLSEKILKIKRKNIKSFDKNLDYHDLFVYILRYKEKVTYFNFGDDNKNYIFKTILTCKLEAIESNLKIFLKDKDYEKFKPECLALSLMTITTSSIAEYERNIKERLNAKYPTKNTKLIYNYVMESPQGFNTYHKNNIEYLMLTIDKISNSKLLDNNYERMSWYMDTVGIAVQIAVLDAERTFVEFNGNFHKLLS